MPHSGSSFTILKHVDSTNNYAMAKVHAGMAKHGNAWFSGDQTAGKGQRGKLWLTGAGENMALSVIINPKELNIIHPFQLLMVVGLACFDLFSSRAGNETRIKWPNDIYWRDRKAGGVLIENKFSGILWKWAVVGVGINVNQKQFDPGLSNAVSLIQITGKNFDTVELAKELHELVLKRADELLTKSCELILAEYNEHLYKLNEPVRLKKGNRVFETTIRGVSLQGRLLTDAIEKHFDFGEVEWIL